MHEIADVGLVIFDCDGVVVDSELLAIKVMQEGLAERGVVMRLDEVSENFLGRSQATIAAVLKRDFDLELDAAAEAMMRERLFGLLRKELKAIDGVELFLRQLPVPYCLASSSQMERIETSLRATGLSDLFAGRIFNAAMVARGKPAPDLFLHAAAKMNVPPERCVVIEDSPAGIEAGRRAGMCVIGFIGGGHATSPAHRRSVAEAGPDFISDTMADVAALFDFVPLASAR